ncbi:MAG TPA: hypothetical protein VH593_15535, partial [Ktedonobacteraceae bacterium]
LYNAPLLSIPAGHGEGSPGGLGIISSLFQSGKPLANNARTAKFMSSVIIVGGGTASDHLSAKE